MLSYRLTIPLALLLTIGCADREPQPALANDNRVAAGTIVDGIVHVMLDARPAGWLPDNDVDSALTVQAFAERDGVPRVPGPLIRVSEGTTVRVTVRNSTDDSVLVLHGVPVAVRDSIVVLRGKETSIDFTAGPPGTFLYWGTTTGNTLEDRTGRDAQLTGAIVVDPVGAPRDTAERVFVITMMDVLPDTTKPLAGQSDIFDVAINGKSWPHTERLIYSTGDTVRWRWVNGGQLTHPMHLHGFHFRVLSKGDGSVDTLYAADAVPTVVTEWMRTGTTFSMEFVPTREGRWLFHCHMVEHILPFPARPDSVRAHALHNPGLHARQSMSGLVLGIDVFPAIPARATEVEAPDGIHLRIYAQEERGDSNKLQRRGFVLARGREPRSDSVEVPGTPLILTRGVRTEITVINRLSEPTSVHWHGMELASYFDGVAGWSGAGMRMGPLIAPGDSFTVAFTPPRAGTFMYHTHMEEEEQLHMGLFGPMIVLEPGAHFDPATDLIFMIGEVRTPGTNGHTINGLREIAPRTLVAGRTYRVRIINIQPDGAHEIILRRDSTELVWTPVAKDGADLPAARRSPRAAKFAIAVGETYDFLWTPTEPMNAQIGVRQLGQQHVQAIPLHVR